MWVNPAYIKKLQVDILQSHTHRYLLVWWTVSSKTKLWECHYMVSIQTLMTVDHLFHHVNCQVWWCSLSVVVIVLHERSPPLCTIFPEKLFWCLEQQMENLHEPQIESMLGYINHLWELEKLSWKMLQIITLSTHKPGSKTNKLWDHSALLPIHSYIPLDQPWPFEGSLPQFWRRSRHGCRRLWL